METASSVQQIIGKKFEFFPDDLKSVVGTTPLANIIFQVGRDHGLAIDKIGYLSEVVGDFLAGDIEAKDIIPTIQDRLSLSIEKSREIAKGINRLVFRPLREKLRGLSERPSSATPVPPAVSPTMPPPSFRVTPPPQVPKSQPLEIPKPETSRRPEPLIIRPLPSSRPVYETPRSTSAKTAGENKWPISDINGGTPPKPSVPLSVPITGTAPRTAEKPAVVPTPVEHLPMPMPAGASAPVIRPFGVHPPPPASKTEMLSQPPSPPQKTELQKPPPPAAAYNRVKEQVEKELAAFRSIPAPEKPPEAKPLPVTTKELLRQEIEKFRTPPPSPTAGGPPQRPEVPSTEASPPKEPASAPLKLPSQKIPKPSAPEKYTTDPYKELPE